MRFRPVYIRSFQYVSIQCTSDPSNTVPPSIHKTLPMRFRPVYILSFQCVSDPVYIRPFQCFFAPCTSDPSNTFPPSIHQTFPMRFRPVKPTSDRFNAFPTRIHRLATSVLITHVLLLFSRDLQTCKKSFQYSSKAYPSAEEAVCGLNPCLWPFVPLIL